VNQFVENLKRSAQENPIATIAVAAVAVTAVAKLIDAAGHAQGSRAYAKQVNARVRKS
jgi:hypothetical protein